MVDCLFSYRQLMSRIAKSLFWLFVFVIGLSACSTADEPTTPELVIVATNTAVPPTAANTPTPDPTELPTETPVLSEVEAAVPTATLQPTNTPISTATPTPSPTAESSPAPADLGFHPIDFAKFPVEALWIAPDGRLWVDSEAGLWERTPENIFRARTRTLHVQILGADSDGRIWALFDDGRRIAYHLSGTEWASFGPGDGWEPTNSVEHNGIIIDRQEHIWMALGRDGLRRFDPHSAQWTTLRAAAVGFAPPPDERGDWWAYDPHLSFTDVALDSFGNVWASACPVQVYTDGPLATQFGPGEGARWFDGEEWAGSDQITDRCVYDLAVDGNGRVWLAGPQNDLWTGYNDFTRYDPHSGAWESLPVPVNEELYGGRPAFVGEILFDPTGAVWLLVEIRGGASFPAPALYRRQNDAWVLEMLETPGTIWFDPAGRLWVADYDALHAGEEEISVPDDLMDVSSFVVDGDGRIWFIGIDGYTLWYYDAP